METLSAASLDVVRDYAMGMEALSDSRNEDARKSFEKAVQRDPKFGAAYAAMAIASANIGQQQEAEQYVKQAVRHLDSMTERERYRTRGLFYYVTGDYQACVKEYSDLVGRYASDAAAHNNLALCWTNLRNLPLALEEMRRVVAILPKRALYRVNLALYAAYGSDFQTGEQEARVAEELGSRWGVFALAFAQLGQGQVVQATETYQRLGKIDELGASQAASGLGDLAIYEGRFSDAVRILETGAAADVASKNPDRAAAKFAMLATRTAPSRTERSAIAAAERALAISNAAKIRFLAARVFVGGRRDRQSPSAGRGPGLRAAGRASGLCQDHRRRDLSAERKSAPGYQGPDRSQRPAGYMDRPFRSWAGLPGSRVVHAGRFRVRPVHQAPRRGAVPIPGRGTDLRYLPVRLLLSGPCPGGAEKRAFADSYRTYLNIRGKSREDPLLPDVRKRAGV